MSSTNATKRQKDRLAQTKSICRQQFKGDLAEMKFVFDRAENIAEKGENVGYQHFSFFHNVFKLLIL